MKTICWCQVVKSDTPSCNNILRYLKILKVVIGVEPIQKFGLMRKQYSTVYLKDKNNYEGLEKTCAIHWKDSHDLFIKISDNCTRENQVACSVCAREFASSQTRVFQIW